MKKILVINFGGIGDEILFFPTLKTIKEIYPQSEITLVAEPRSKSAKDLTDLVDDVITCDIKGQNKRSEILKFLITAWQRKFDIVFSSGGSKVVSILLFLTGIKEKYGYDSGALSQKILTKAIPLKKDQYAGDMYNDLTNAISSNKKAGLPEVYVSQENIDWANSIIDKKDKKIVLVHPGVSRLSIKKNIIKFWPSENWVKLIIDLLNHNEYKVVLVGGPDDEEVFKQIRAEIEEKNTQSNNLLDLYGKTKNISQLAGLIKASDLLVCVDSAPMHVAVGVGTPVAAIFGPTDENKLLPVWDSRFTAVRNDSVNCRPCLWDKRQVSCDKTNCLNISPETIIEVIKNKLQ